jgi:hypothetical protein
MIGPIVSMVRHKEDFQSHRLTSNPRHAASTSCGGVKFWRAK